MALKLDKATHKQDSSHPGAMRFQSCFIWEKIMKTIGVSQEFGAVAKMAKQKIICCRGQKLQMSLVLHLQIVGTVAWVSILFGKF